MISPVPLSPSTSFCSGLYCAVALGPAPEQEVVSDHRRQAAHVARVEPHRAVASRRRLRGEGEHAGRGKHPHESEMPLKGAPDPVQGRKGLESPHRGYIFSIEMA